MNTSCPTEPTEQNYCKVFNSGLKCPLTCRYPHCEAQKKKVQELQKLNLYFKARSGLLKPKKEELTTFYNHLSKNKICFRFYLLEECKYGDSCWFYHVFQKDQKDSLFPVLSKEIIEVKAKNNEENSKKNNEEKAKGNTEEKTKNDEEWQIHQKKCKYGLNCLKKNDGCLFSHESEEKSSEMKENTKKNLIKKSNWETESEVSSKKSVKNTGISEKAKKLEENLKKSLKESKNSKKKKKYSSESEEDSEETEEKEEDNEEKNKESDENEEEEEKCSEIDKNCEKCKKKKANCVFIPCYHCNYCMGCADKVYNLSGKKCSLCWKKIEFLKIKD